MPLRLNDVFLPSHTGSYTTDARTPLTIALECQHVPVIRLLLNHGAIFNPEVMERNYFDQGVLQRIIQTGRMHLIRLFIGAGADLNPDRLSGTIVHNMCIPYTAPEEEREELLLLLTQTGIN